jgi:CRISPR-associated endonuclease Csn1
LVVACTQQGFIQRINTLSASDVKDEMNKEIELAKIEYNEKLTLLEKYLISKMPFNTFQVANEADKILVSVKAGKKAATTGVRKIKQDGKKQIVQRGIIVPRGALHEQFVYGKIKVTDNSKPIKHLFENISSIISPIIREKVSHRIAEYNGDIKKALNSVKKSPIWLDEKNSCALEAADCFRDEFVIRYKLKDLKAKDVPFIIDKKVKNLVQQRLDQFDGNEKEAFKNPLWFNEPKQIPINTIRLFTYRKEVVPVKFNENGDSIGYVVPGNNHHIAIYKDAEGKVHQHVCTFWHAVERKKNKLPVIIKKTNDVWSVVLNQKLPQSFIDKLPPDNAQLYYSLQQNETFILGLSEEEFKIALEKDNKPLLSKHLYLVWSVADNDFWFRHHLETKNTELKKIVGAKESKRLHRVSLSGLNQLNPIKIRLNHLGLITKIGE